MRVGLTGGIASGKTTVANLFAARSVAVIDTDLIARALVEPGQAALTEIVSTFGPEVCDSAGGLDRKSMRKLVFSDSSKRRELEKILHPRIAHAMAAQACAAGGDYQILVVPLLLESGMDKEVDRILVVDCPADAQLKRLMTRDNETTESAQRILDAQIDRASRRARAHDLIVNDGQLQALDRAVAHLDGSYKRLAH